MSWSGLVRTVFGTARCHIQSTVKFALDCSAAKSGARFTELTRHDPGCGTSICVDGFGSA